MIFNIPITYGNKKKQRLHHVASEQVVLNNSHIIVELGQSNMSGQSGNTANPLFPFPNTHGVFWNGSSETQLISTRGSAGEGSEATYFADKYFELFGVAPVMVESASSGTNMLQWGVGSLRNNAQAKISTALAHYGVASPKALLWCQGESDGKYYDTLYTSRLEMKNALQSIVDWWFSLYPNSVFLISETGAYTGASYEVNLITVREIQQEICNENTKVYMAFTGAKNFVSQGKMKDSVHYNYIGLKEMGEAFAVKLNEINQ